MLCLLGFLLLGLGLAFLPQDFLGEVVHILFKRGGMGHDLGPCLVMVRA